MTSDRAERPEPETRAYRQSQGGLLPAFGPAAPKQWPQGSGPKAAAP